MNTDPDDKWKMCTSETYTTLEFAVDSLFINTSIKGDTKMVIHIN